MYKHLEKILEYGLAIALFAPLIVGQALVFPLVTTKTFFFYILVDVLFCVYLLLLTQKPLYPKKNKLFYLFLGYIFLGFILNIFGINFWQSFWGNYERMMGIYTTLHLMIYLWMLLSIYNTPEKYLKLFKIITVAGFLVGVYGLLQSAGVRSWGIVISKDARSFSTIGNAAYLASYILIYLFITVYLMIRESNKYWRIFYLTSLLLGFYTLAATATRGALVGLGAAVILMFWYIVLFYKKNKIRLICLGLSALIIAGVVAIFIFKDSSFIRNNLALRRVSEINLQTGSSQSRLLLWKMVFTAVKDKPALGWGENNIRIPLDKYHDYNLEEEWFDSSHNQFLDILLAHGIIGLSAYLFFIFILYYSLFRIRKEQFWLSAFFLGLLTAYLIQSLFIFDSFAALLILFAAFGYLFLILNLNPPKADKSIIPRGLPRKLPLVIPRPLAAGKFINEAGLTHDKNLPKYAGTTLVILIVFVGSFVYLRSIPPAYKVVKAYRLVATDIDGANALFKEAEKQALYGYDVIAPTMTETAVVILKNSNKYTRGQLAEFVNVFSSVYKKAIAASNGFSKFYVNLAQIYQLARDIDPAYLDESVIILEEALQSSPNRINIYYVLSQSYFFLEDYQKAEDILKEALKFEAVRDQTYLNLAEVQLRKGNVSDGLANLRQAMGLGIVLDIAKLESFARLLIEREEWTGAAEIFVIIDRAQPNNPDTYSNIAMAYKKSGDKEKAIEWIKKVEELDPRQHESVQEFIKNL